MGISPGYFLDDMSLDELGSLLKADFETNKISWEQTRTLAFYILVTEHGTKTYDSPKKVFPLPWDELDVEGPERTLPLENYKEFAEKLIKKKHGQK